ncbi:MAG: hypothetical protein AB7F99_00450 [Vicinamibacterales bacterium]
MNALFTVLGTLALVGIPGAAALFWARRSGTSTARTSDLPRAIAISYAGVGLASISLWLFADAFGMSPLTSAVAPLAVAALIGAAGFRRWRRDTEPGGPETAPNLDAGESRAEGRATTVLAGLAFASIVLVAIPFAPYGWERADGVHRMAMTDWEKHLVMTTGIVGSPTFPPPHPYLHADPEPSYYFGYQLVAAAVTLVSHPDADAFGALWLLTLFTAAATPFVVYVFARDLFDARPALIAAAAATLLVGFDLIVVAIDALRAAYAAWPLPDGLAGLRALIPSTHIDYWIHNLDRSFSAPVVTTMWAPHQTAATLIALIVMHLLGPRADAAGRPRAGMLLPGLLIASLAGLSTYVALALGTGVAASALVDAWQTRRLPWRTGVFRRWIGAGAIGVVVALPILPTVAHGSSSGLILRLSAAGTWSNGAFFSWLFGRTQWALLLDTPAVYLFELGVIGLLAFPFLYRHARRLDPGQREAAIVAMAVLVLVTFVRPPVDVGNNLYARALLLVWFLLAPFAAARAMELRRARWLRAAVVVCAAGTAYAEIGYLLEGTLFWATPRPAVEAMRWINTNTPRTALVAVRPADYENIYGNWLRRPLVIGGKRLAVLFGADPFLYDRTSEALEEAFSQQTADSARDRFDALDADVMLMKNGGTDPVWATAPCFAIPHRNSEWTVIFRERAGCASAGPSASRSTEADRVASGLQQGRIDAVPHDQHLVREEQPQIPGRQGSGHSPEHHSSLTGTRL